MQSVFSKALSKAVSNHIELSETRRETLTWLALLVMQQGTICLWRLAAYVSTRAQTDSVRRRFYRFFQYVRLDGTGAARVVIDLLGLAGKPWVLAIDRTNWDFGKTTINILMISVMWHGMGIPLIWSLLPKAGNSNTGERTDLLDRLQEAFPDLKIASIMGDREFIGDAWMSYLKRNKIAFIMRLREIHLRFLPGAVFQKVKALRISPFQPLHKPLHRAVFVAKPMHLHQILVDRHRIPSQIDLRLYPFPMRHTLAHRQRQNGGQSRSTGWVVLSSIALRASRRGWYVLTLLAFGAGRRGGTFCFSLGNLFDCRTMRACHTCNFSVR